MRLFIILGVFIATSHNFLQRERQIYFWLDQWSEFLVISNATGWVILLWEDPPPPSSSLMLIGSFIIVLSPNQFFTAKSLMIKIFYKNVKLLPRPIGLYSDHLFFLFPVLFCVVFYIVNFFLRINESDCALACVSVTPPTLIPSSGIERGENFISFNHC